MAEESKQRTAIWLYPETIRRIDGWLEEDNCKTRSEFIEKALRFYMGYLASVDVSGYLSDALVCTLRGVLDDNENRLRTLLFKWAVELEMTMSVVAAHFKDDDIALRELRRYAVEEVKRTNGQLSFDESLRTQRLPLHPDGEWRG